MNELPSHDPATLKMMHADFEKRDRIFIPPVVAADGDVIDGKARLAYAEEHGIEIPEPILVGNLSAREKQELRLALNVHRRHLTREQVRQLVADELRADSARSDRMIAGKLGVSHTTVAKVRGGRPGHLDDGKRKGADGKMHPARKPVFYSQTRTQTKEAIAAMQTLGDSTPTGTGITVRKLRRAKSQHDMAVLLDGAKDARPHDAVILASDFRKAPSDWRADLFVTDPPWDAWKELGFDLGKAILRILKPGGIVAMYTGTYNQFRWVQELERAGLHYQGQTVAVHKTKGGVCNHGGALRHLHTPIVILNRHGDTFRSPHPLATVFERGELTKQAHPWQQPVSDAEFLIRHLSRPGYTVCDLFSCTGTVAVATHRVGEGRSFVGCELDAKLVKFARHRLAEEQRAAKGA